MADEAKLYRMAATIVAKADSAAGAMEQLLAKLDEQYPDKLWAQLRKVSYGQDAAPFEKWIKQLLSKQPPGPKIRDLSLLIQDLCNVELEGNRGRVKDEEWPDEEPGYQPEQETPALKSPDAMWELLDGCGDEDEDEKRALSYSDLEYVLALVFYGMLLKDAYRKLGAKVFLADAEQRQLVVGWHDGDPLVVGEAGKEGLKAPKVKTRLGFGEAREAGLMDEKMEELLTSVRDPASAVARMLEIAVGTKLFGRSPVLKKIKPEVLAADVSTLTEWMKATLPPLIGGQDFNTVSFPVGNHWVIRSEAHAFELNPETRRWPAATNAYPREKSKLTLSRTELSDRLFYDHDQYLSHAADAFLLHATFGIAARLMADDVCARVAWEKQNEILLLTGGFDCACSLARLYAGSLTPESWAWRGWRKQERPG